MEENMKRWTNLAIIAAVVGLVACGSDTAAPTLGGDVAANRGAPAGTDTSSDSTQNVPGTPPPQPTPNAPVAHFNLKVIALGAIVGADTSGAEKVAGAAVTVVRVGGIQGDTLATPETLGTGTTDANGEAAFAQLPGGFYTIRITPPAGSPYSETQSALFPPRYDNISVSVTMRRP
jgi:hypothetical protein